MSSHQKGTQTQLADRACTQTTWNGVLGGEGKGHPHGVARYNHHDNAREGQQGGGGGDGKRQGAGAYNLPRALHKHEQGTAPAKAVVVHNATHQPRG